jgi:transcriptional regulator with XRE-family HTH domain
MTPEHAPLLPAEVALAAQLRAERAAAGMTQDQLADAAGLHRMVYIRLETAKRHANVGQLVKIAEAVELPLSELLSRAEDRMVRAQGRAMPETPEP